MTQDARCLFGTPELAHWSLRDSFPADRYDSGVRGRVSAPLANMHPAPDSPALLRQALMGTPLQVLDPSRPISLARNEDTGYVGWVHRDVWVMHTPPTHRVSARQTLLFDAPDIKAPNPLPASCGAKLVIFGTEGRFSRTLDERFVVSSHITPLDQPEPDYIDVAQRLAGTPYLWGGDGAAGIDCSGLVGLALRSAGIACPGDSDQQEQSLAYNATTLAPGDPPQRGDLFFWKGHVALACSTTTLIHANAHAMCVAYEPISEAIDRIKAQGGGPVTSHLRLGG